MINKRVKIVRDTVSHRIPIGNIVRIKSEYDKTIKGKKCWNILDLNCYVSEDDIEVLSEEEEELKTPVLINEIFDKNENKDLKKADDTWFDSYSDTILKSETKSTKENKFKKGDKVYARNVTALTPNGTQNKAKDGVYFFYEIANNRIWLRRNDKTDLNEYFCLEKDVKK
jgi:hypothetical protein